MVSVETVTYGGWDECVRITNGTIELVATTGVGPRIVHFSFVDGDNVLYLDPEATGTAGGNEWELYGGHRLWHAPEAEPRTYVPDNDAVAYELTDEGCLLTQDAEALTGLRKEIEVRMDGDTASVEIGHRITNDGVWPVEFAPWGITVLAPGGTAVVPLESGDPDELLPDRTVTLWPYTDPSDDRLEWIDDGLLVQQTDGEPTKVGASGEAEWTAYVNDGTALIKQFEHDPEGTYPDRGSAVEVYTLTEMLELETLAPLSTVEPEQTVEHVERWSLQDGVVLPETGADIGDIAPSDG